MSFPLQDTWQNQSFQVLRREDPSGKWLLRQAEFEAFWDHTRRWGRQSNFTVWKKWKSTFSSWPFLMWLILRPRFFSVLLGWVKRHLSKNSVLLKCLLFCSLGKMNRLLLGHFFFFFFFLLVYFSCFSSMSRIYEARFPASLLSSLHLSGSI